ncbi:MAG: host attachment protein [Gammaproteobacteria bacterium]|nr:host attachment protein [Gammaproteobacteria bacterium]
MSANWVVVANESRARIFANAEKREPLQSIKNILRDSAKRRPAGGEQLKTEDGNNRTPEGFARKIATIIVEARKAGDFNELHIVAEESFSSILISQFDSATRKLIKKNINQDLAGKRLPDIRRILEETIS